MDFHKEIFLFFSFYFTEKNSNWYLSNRNSSDSDNCASAMVNAIQLNTRMMPRTNKSRHR